MMKMMNRRLQIGPASALVAATALALAAIGCEGRSTPPASTPAAAAPTVAPLPPQSELSEPTPIGKKATRRSGLEYETLKEGEGPMAATGDLVTVHYTGTLEDGKVFDTSRESGKPMTFTLGERRLILGWNEGIAGMKAGERRKLTLPPNVAYGALGNLPMIPPNATLSFDIELIKIEKAPASPDGKEVGSE